jgi:1-deoxy-D-xylulose-5-phosphate synthase
LETNSGAVFISLCHSSCGLYDEVAIIALGDFYSKGLDLYNELKNELNINSTLINPRFASGIDNELLDSLLLNHKLIITLEDGILEGGFGSKISNYYSDKDIIVVNPNAEDSNKKDFLYHSQEKYIPIEDPEVARILATLIPTYDGIGFTT